MFFDIGATTTVTFNAGGTSTRWRRLRNLLAVFGLGILSAQPALAADVVISEFPASNTLGLNDRDDDDSNCIELSNISGSAIDLEVGFQAKPPYQSRRFIRRNDRAYRLGRLFSLNLDLRVRARASVTAPSSPWDFIHASRRMDRSTLSSANFGLSIRLLRQWGSFSTS